MNLSLPLFDALPPGPPPPAARQAVAAPAPGPGRAGAGRSRTAAAGPDLFGAPAADAGLADANTDTDADADADADAGRTAQWLMAQPTARVGPPLRAAVPLPALPCAPPVSPASPGAPPHALRDPVALHPSLWRASQVGGGRRRVTASGFDLLDAQLPGGGWPHGELTELLLAQPGIGELRLLAPALAAVAQAGDGTAAGDGAVGSRCVMLFDPPAALSAWALLQQGLSSRHWLVVHSRAGHGTDGGPGGPPRGAPRGANRLAPLLPGADLLWALEQALRSGQLGAALAWLPLSLRADALRRLQLAAQAHDGPVFMFRDAQARSRPSAAPLRLLLQPAGVDGLSLRLLKRRGPPLADALRLALPSVLTPRQQAQALARQALQGAGRLARSGAAGAVAPR